jgi:hypothetical protein
VSPGIEETEGLAHVLGQGGSVFDWSILKPLADQNEVFRAAEGFLDLLLRVHVWSIEEELLRVQGVFRVIGSARPRRKAAAARQAHALLGAGRCQHSTSS